MYDPGLGRFLQTDPVGYDDGPNWYAYVGNDPVNATDPTGQDTIDCKVTVTTDGAGTIECQRVEDNNDLLSRVNITIRQQHKRDDGSVSTTETRVVDWIFGDSSAAALGVAKSRLELRTGQNWSDEPVAFPGAPRSTGRTMPRNLREQLAMQQARSNPAAGQAVPVRGGMRDGRWPASQGWVKMRQNINNTEVHYNYNTRTGETADWKFK